MEVMVANNMFILTEFREKAEKEGLQMGLKQGLEQGIKQGIEQGMKQGVEKEKMSLAQMMIEEKEPVDKISKYTGYAIDKLKEIAAAMGQTLV
mgnify:FL=1